MLKEHIQDTGKDLLVTEKYVLLKGKTSVSHRKAPIIDKKHVFNTGKRGYE